MGILNRVFGKVLTGQEESWQTQRVWARAHNLTFFSVSFDRFGHFILRYNPLITCELSIISEHGILVAHYHCETRNKDRPR